MGRPLRCPHPGAPVAPDERFHETPLPGVWAVEPELLADERGWFARTFDATSSGRAV